MIDAFQEAMLTSGGDCPLHWHSSPTTDLDDLRRLQQLEIVANVSATTDMATVSDTKVKNADYLRVDATSGTRTITLPNAYASGRRITVSRVAGANTVTVSAQSGETVQGTTSITASFAPHTFKAISETEWEEV